MKYQNLRPLNFQFNYNFLIVGEVEQEEARPDHPDRRVGQREDVREQGVRPRVQGGTLQLLEDEGRVNF